MSLPVPVGPGAPVVDPELARRYAELVVRLCVPVSPGDRVIVQAEPAHRQLVVALAEAAYAAGARWVGAVDADPWLQRARILHGSDDALGVPSALDVAGRDAAVGPDAILIAIRGEEHADLMADLPGERVGLDAARRSAAFVGFSREMLAGRVRFGIVAWPTFAWAQRVFPTLEPEDAASRLLADLVAFTRLDAPDPIAATRAHVATLAARAHALDALALDRLELRGPGTHLDVGLTPDAVWCHVGEERAYGCHDIVNWPSEEVFTSPDPARVEGTFACTRPVSVSGREIRGLRGEIHGGRLVDADADDRGALAVLLGLLDGDEGGRRLGEIALVDATSPIGRTGRVYGDTLLDENAASHMAFGAGMAHARRADGPVNASATHIDVMIGSDALEVVGVRPDGGRVDVIRDGRFVL